MKITVCGGGGAIGGHLVGRLLADGHEVRAVDIKPLSQWWQTHDEAECWSSWDLSRYVNALNAVTEAEWVFDLSDVMGGIGFIEAERVACAESIQIGINLLRASHYAGVDRFFYSSSACVYPTDIQATTDAPALSEDMAWPARSEEGYGLQKLYMEELCRHYRVERGLQTRVARYHNIYGPPSSWNDGKEKSPAAICRKVAEAKLSDSGKIEIWGDGSQRRSYCHVSDCVEGTLALMASDCSQPLNIGSDRDVSVNDLVSLVEWAAGTGPLERVYDLGAPQGVRGRNADLSLVRSVLGWEPRVSLEDGLAGLYQWIEAQVDQGCNTGD